MLTQLEIARTKRETRPKHSLTYRLASRKTLHERSLASLAGVLGFAYIAALSSQLAHLGFFGLYKGVFSLYTLLLASAYFGFGAFLVGLRNAGVQVNPRRSPTVFHDLLSIASDVRSWALVSFYVIAISSLHILILVPSTTLTRNYNELLVFINEKGIEQVNERYILTRMFSIFMGLAFGMYHLLLQKDWISFPNVQLNAIKFVHTNYWTHVVCQAVWFSSRMTAAFWIGYNILLSRFLVNIAMRLASEDILYHAPQYGPRWYSIGLATRLFFSSFSLAVFFESVHLLCDHFLVQKMNVTASSVDPNACIITGLKVDESNSSPETLLTYHAFQELAHLAAHQAARRTDLFSDTTCVPSPWNQLSSRCIAVLDKAAGRIDLASSTAPTTVAADGDQALNSSVRRRLAPGQGGAFESNIFRPTKHDNFFDSLKGSSTEELLAKSRIKTDKTLAEKDSAKRPNVAASRDRLEIVAFRWMSKTIRELVLSHPEIQKQLKKIPSPQVLHATDDLHLVMWSFQSLARLVMASYKEDRYGVVQKDIPRILESMLGLLVTLEAFMWAEGRTVAYEGSSYPAPVNARKLVITQSRTLCKALKTSISQIVVTFQDQLSDLTLATAHADRLRRFTEFQD
ncbi:Nucleoporin NDC1 [Mortierella alpina]|uniref:Nucleoporin NDC1 n=1 Tax=Mortierella alpina TaxID=64518 RepID=A0A9P6M4M6_MORAP|nr:Nucleoporin NDC1 [Mortierella alpina]